jgi:hypothetical protein
MLIEMHLVVFVFICHVLVQRCLLWEKKVHLIKGLGNWFFHAIPHNKHASKGLFIWLGDIGPSSFFCS